MRNILTTCILAFSAILQSFSQNNTDQLSNYLNSFQYQKALDYIDTQAPDKELLEKKVLCYKALGDYDKAIDILLPLSDEYPTDIHIKYELAHCYKSSGQIQNSINCYNNLISLDSSNLYFKIQKADVLFQQESYKEALSMYRDIYKQNETLTTCKRMAQCFDKLNKSDSAIIYFRKVWDKNPKDSYSAAYLINIYLREGLIPSGIEYSEKYIQTDSTNQQINLLNALCYYKKGDYVKTRERLKKCFFDSDSSLVINRTLGLSFHMTQNRPEAIKYLEIAYRKDSTDNNVLYTLGSLYLKEYKYDLALNSFKELLRRTIPEDDVLRLYYQNIAESYDKTGNYKTACLYYEKSLPYAKKDGKLRIYYELGRINKFSLKNHTKGLNYYKQYRKILAEDIENMKKDTKDRSEEIALFTGTLADMDNFIKGLENNK